MNEDNCFTCGVNGCEDPCVPNEYRVVYCLYHETLQGWLRETEGTNLSKPDVPEGWRIRLQIHYPNEAPRRKINVSQGEAK